MSDTIKESCKDTAKISSSKLSITPNNYHMESIFIPYIRKNLKYIRSQDSIDPTEQIFIINQCLKCGDSDINISLRSIELPSNSSSNFDSSISLELKEPSLADAPLTNTFKFPALNEIISLPIDSQHLSQLCFPEHLLFSCKKDENLRSFSMKLNDAGTEKDLLNLNNLKTVGGFSINMESATEISEIKIYISSKFSCQNEKVSTLSIVARTDYNFRTIEEKRVEGLYDPKNGEKKEKTLHVFEDYTQKDKSPLALIGIRSERYGHFFKEFTANIDVEQFGHFMLDGAGFLLMRYLAIIQFTGIIETYSMYLSGEMCQASYKCSIKKNCIFNGFLCNVIKIKRILLLKDFESDISTSLFLDSGHLLRHTWHQCNFVIHMNPLEKLPPNVFSMDINTKWQQDIHLLSIFLEAKIKRSAELKSFIDDEPQVKCLVTDFLISILQKKPDQVVEYAKEYFSAMDDDDHNKVLGIVDNNLAITENNIK